MSPKSELFKAILNRIKTHATKVRYTSIDVGQLENYEHRPPVSWPCALIEFDNLKFSEVGTNNRQIGEGTFTVRVGLVKYTEFSNLTPEQWQSKALEFFEVEQQVFMALHNWAADGFGKILRRASASEKRDDDIKVQVIQFAISYTDITSEPVKQRVPRPNPEGHHNITK